MWTIIPPFFLPLFGCRPTPYKNKVGEQCDCGRIDDLRLIHPLGMLTYPAVLYKFMSVTEIQITIFALKYAFRAPLVGIDKCTSSYFEGDAYECSLFESARRELFHARNQNA